VICLTKEVYTTLEVVPHVELKKYLGKLHTFPPNFKKVVLIRRQLILYLKMAAYLCSTNAEEVAK